MWWLYTERSERQGSPEQISKEDELTEHGEHDKSLFLLQELQNFVKNMFSACHECMRAEGLTLAIIC